MTARGQDKTLFKKIHLMRPWIASIPLLHLLSHHFNGCKSYMCLLKLQTNKKIKYIKKYMKYKKYIVKSQ